ncbi:MAG: ATP-dependent Clp protease adaptor ClpS [Prochloraceae cyanobacterium]
MNQQRSLSLNSDQNLDTFSTRDNYRNRQLLLNKVKNYWLRGVLEKSLCDQSALELRLEERLDALELPLGVAWETSSQARQPLPPETRVIDTFEQMGEGRSLLILGEPGSGKTTTLLQLARDLIAQAEQDTNKPIPVIFNLSSFFDISSGINEKQAICQWLVEELHAQYQIPKHIGQTWVREQQLLLLLDGLDELARENRQLCVKALNEFGRACGSTEIVVCSRCWEYENLSERLRLQAAIYIQPLTPEQVDRYLAALGEEMAALRTLLTKEPILQELVKTPLMLSAIALAYQGMSPENLSNLSIEESHKHLFNAYIQRMFSRRGSSEPYSQEQSVRWLSELALRMSRESPAVFLIERIQPSWLRVNHKDKFTLPWQRNRKKDVKIYQLYTTGVQLVNGLIWGLIVVLSFLAAGSGTNLLVGGTIAGIIGAATTKIEPIHTVEHLKWSWVKLQKWLPVGLLLGLGGFFSAGASWGLFVGLSGILIAGLIEEEIRGKTFPNQGIWQSAKTAVSFGLSGGFLCLVGGVGIEGYLGLPYPISMSLFGSGILSLILGLMKGGQSCIQHLVLRLILYLDGSIPWNYARFLNYAADRNFLQKVGGGYIFIHRLLQDHFAALAREKYQQHRKVSSQDARTYLERGNLRANLGDIQGAIADYDRAIEINRDLAEAYAGRSLACYMLGDDRQVLDDYHQTYNLNPELARSITYTAKNFSHCDLAEIRFAGGETPHQRRDRLAANIVKQDSPQYLVTLLNDNVNGFDYVYKCLMKYIPGMTRDRAWQLTMEVHNQGQAVIWSGAEHLAELYQTQLSQAGLSLDLCWPDVEERD